MGIQTAPAYIAKQADGVTDFQHPVELMRNFNQGLFLTGGVFRNGDFFVQSSGVGMGITVDSGNAHLLGTHNSSQGGYFLWSNSQDTLTLGAASGSTRYDTVLLRVADNQYGTITGAPRAYLEVVAGAPGAGAARADSYFQSGGGSYQPGAWLRLADIRVDPGDTTVSNAKITYTRQYIALPGGVYRCLSTSRPTWAEFGDKILEVDTGLEYQYDATNWNYTGNWSRTVTVSSATNTISFTSIPRGIKHLQLTGTMKGTVGTPGSALLVVNNDTANNYKFQSWNNFNTGTTNQANISAANIPFALPEVAWGTLKIDFLGWNSPHSGWLTILGHAGYINATNGDSNNTTFSGAYTNATGNYNSLRLQTASGNFITGSQFVLKGVA